MMYDVENETSISSYSFTIKKKLSFSQTFTGRLIAVCTCEIKKKECKHDYETIII